MPTLAHRLSRVEVAASVAMTIKARELRASGADVIQLTVGEPDFATPVHAIAAAHAAALAGKTKYPPVDGTIEMKRAIQAKFKRDQKLDFAFDEVMVSNGGKQVVFDALMATLNDGDEVVIPAPYWSAYPLAVKLIGGEPVFVNCPENYGFKLRAEDLEAAITPRTKWLFLNFPNNPTGAACSRAQLADIAAVMMRHPDVWILSDDMYEHLVYDGFEITTLAAVEPRLRERTLTMSGVSKTYAMTGWRIGFCGGPKHLIKAMTNVQGQMTLGISTIGQAAATAALDGPQEHLPAQVEIYRRRRDFVVDALNGIPGISCHRPEGAFFVYPNIASCLGRVTAGGRRIETDEDFALALLEEAYVAVVHGASYGMSPYIRISYATDDASLQTACTRIAAFVAGLT